MFRTRTWCALMKYVARLLLSTNCSRNRARGSSTRDGVVQDRRPAPRFSRTPGGHPGTAGGGWAADRGDSHPAWVQRRGHRPTERADAVVE